MDYLRFLGAWYNLPFLGLVAGGLFLGLRHRECTADVRTSKALVLFAAGICGLTLNGAIHDFQLGSFGRWFPPVLVASLVAGWLVARLVARVRRRVFPPVTGVTFNQPGLEGLDVVVLSASIAPGESGRARYRDCDGVAHVVRVHRLPASGDAPIRFGGQARLGRFDAELDAYVLDRV